MNIYLWNPRGRVVSVAPNEVGELLGRGYLQPTKKELKRIEEGKLIYSQVYDQGARASSTRREAKPEKLEIKKQGDVIKTEMI